MKIKIQKAPPLLLEGPKVEVDAAAAPHRSVLRRAIEEFPSQSAQLASLPIVVGFMAITGGAGIFGKLAGSIAAGDAMGAVAVTGVSMYALLATGCIAQLKEGMRSSDHDRAEAAKTGALQKSVDQIERRLEQNRKRDMAEMRNSIEQVIDQINHLGQEYVLRKSAEKFTRKNDADVFDNYAPASTVYVVNGQCRLDVTSEIRADGSTRLVPNFKRLIPWLKRYGHNGIASANIIVFTDDSLNTKPTSVPPQIAYYLTAFRALKKLAKAYNVNLRLNCVRFFLQKKSNARPSYFVGTYALYNKTMDFVISYCDFATMFNVPRTLLDDDVEINYSPDDVAKFRNLAEMLMAGVPCLSLNEMESRYGRLVPDDSVLDPRFVECNPFVAVGNVQDDASDDIITNGDHFVIRRSEV